MSTKYFRLAREGRFEFVQGGWVQNDEANTHYFAMFNQMLDGHYWLKDNFPGSYFILLRVYELELYPKSKQFYEYLC